jgi:uncharacterized protein
MIVVADSTILILFAKIGKFNLLQSIFGEIVIPQSVYNEVAVIGFEKAGAYELKVSNWIKIMQIQNQESVNLLIHKYRRLSLADVEAIVLSQEIGADFLLTDDRKLRNIAKSILTKTGLMYTGAVLILAKYKGLIDSVRYLLDMMREVGLRIDSNTYNDILLEAKEQDEDTV